MLYDRAIVREIARTVPLWEDETFIASIETGINAYLITSFGRFYSCKSKRWMRWWTTKKAPHCYNVTLSINGVQRNLSVKKLLAQQTDDEYARGLNWDDLARRNNEASERSNTLEPLDVVKF